MSANLAASVSNFFIGEIDIDEIKNLNKVFSNSPDINRRFLKRQDSPGWGCKLNEKHIKKVFSAKN